MENFSAYSLLGNFAAMYIPKPFHPLFTALLSGISTMLTFPGLRGHMGFWAVLVAAVCFPVAWLLGSIIVDVADGLLRRFSRDPFWVLQHERRKKT